MGNKLIKDEHMFSRKQLKWIIAILCILTISLIAFLLLPKYLDQEVNIHVHKSGKIKITKTQKEKFSYSKSESNVEKEYFVAEEIGEKGVEDHFIQVQEPMVVGSKYYFYIHEMKDNLDTPFYEVFYVVERENISEYHHSGQEYFPIKGILKSQSGVMRKIVKTYDHDSNADIDTIEYVNLKFETTIGEVDCFKRVLDLRVGTEKKYFYSTIEVYKKRFGLYWKNPEIVWLSEDPPHNLVEVSSHKHY